MKHQIFAVFDSAADAYMNPFFLPSKGMAIRSFSDSVNTPDSTLSKHPADYTLFHLGEWTDESAGFDLFPGPRSLGVAIEFVSQDLIPDEQLAMFKKESVA